MKPLPKIEELIDLHGKTALVTGAATGIGRAIARRFAEAGADLILVDLNESGLRSVKEQLEEFGVDMKLYTVDLSKKKEIDRLWNSLEEGPDILVNNAGIYPFKGFLKVEESFYEHVLGTNLDAVYWMCQNMIRKRGKKGSVIVNVSSIEAVVSFNEDLAHYSIAKSGVIALTRALAKEHGRHGFRVNAILPGGIITTGTKATAKRVLKFDLKLIKTGYDFKQRLPIGRFGRPDEVARMVLVLSSDLASYVHGATIPIDGGFLAV